MNQRAFYGWTILAVAGLGIFAGGPGQSHTFSVFVSPIGKDLGLSSGLIATAYGAATLGAAFCLPFMGRLVDRYGSRRMSMVAIGLLGLACMAFGAAAGLISLALGFAALRFFGQGSVMMTSTNLVAQWFSRKRGFAMSLMALGFGISMAVHPPLGQYLIAQFGWRSAWVLLGLMTWLIMLPPLLLLVYNKPEDCGLHPDGDAQADTAGGALHGLSLREARATSAFYILAVGWFSIAMLVTTLHFYQVTILQTQGVAVEIAARVFPVSAITMVLAMPFVGRAFDRTRTRYVFGMGLLITASSLVAITFVQNLYGAIAYAILFGVNNAFSMTMFGYLMPRYFGRKHLGSLQGTGQMFAVIGASLGPLPVGLAFDYLGDATLTLRILAALPFVCFIAAMFLRTPAGVPHSPQQE